MDMFGDDVGRDQGDYVSNAENFNSDLPFVGITKKSSELTPEEKRIGWDFYLKHAPKFIPRMSSTDYYFDKYCDGEKLTIPLPEDPPPEFNLENYTLRDRIWFTSYFGKDTKRPYKNCDDSLDRLYQTLFHRLMTRRMRERGYAIDPTWGEKERRQKIYEENQKKYPWMYK